MREISVFYDHMTQACQQSEVSLEEVFRKVAEAGITGLEINGTQLLEQEDLIAALLQKYRIKISCIYEFYDWGRVQKKAGASDASGDKGVQAQIDLAVKYGAGKVLVVPGFLIPKEAEELKAQKTREEIWNFLDQNEAVHNMCQMLSHAVQYGKERGVYVTLEDFDGKEAAFARKEELAWFLERIPGLRFTFDMGNFTFSDEDPRTAYEQLKRKIVHVHCKDRGIQKSVTGLKNNRGLTSVAVGEGYLPMRKMVEELCKEGYDTYFAIEHFDAENQLSTIVRSAENLHSWIRDL